MLGLFYYAWIVGFRPPVTRAVIMSSLFLIGRSSQRRYDLFNILALAGLIILWQSPKQLFSPGFQLSFSAIIGIVLFTGKAMVVVENSVFGFVFRGSFGKWLGGAVMVSLGAFLGTVPLVAFHFSIIPVWGILLNIFIVPAIGFIVLNLFVMVILSLIWSPLGCLYCELPDLSIRLLTQLLIFMQSSGMEAIQLPRVSWCIPVIMYTGIAGLLCWRQNWYRKICIYGLWIVLNLFLWLGTEKVTLRVTILDVGQGDAIILELPEDRVVLIDAGNRTKEKDYGKEVVVPYLQYLGVKELEVVICSHSDYDHAAGIPAVVDEFDVHEIWYASEADPAPIMDTLLFQARSLQIPVRSVCAGFDTLIAGVSFRTFFPFSVPLDRKPNNNSIVQMIRFGKTTFLTTGDIEQEVERSLLPYGTLLKTDFLKVPHHGSITSSSLPFIRTVQPSVAVISVGLRNAYSLPSKEVLLRYQSEQIPTLLTSKQGAIVFESNGERWSQFEWK